jgi:hypothetical protein
MSAVTGCPAAGCDGLFDGPAVGLCVVFVPDGLGDVPPPDGLGLAEVEVVEEARAPEPDDFIRAGTAMSAPMTRNTAAMTTLGNCIAVLLARVGALAAGRGDPGSFLT